MDGKSMTEAERLAERTPERIWLIDMGDCIAWCDDPDPSGTGEDDAVEYVRAALIRSQAEELERLRGALRDVGVAWDSAPTVAGLLDGRAAKWFFDTLAPAMIAARKALNEQAARAALGEAKAAPEQEQDDG